MHVCEFCRRRASIFYFYFLNCFCQSQFAASGGFRSTLVAFLEERRKKFKVEYGAAVRQSFFNAVPTLLAEELCFSGW